MAQRVVINEFLAANERGLRDANGQRTDWIELYNCETTAVALGGWHLTDAPQDLAKWTFPATNIPARGHLVVFASDSRQATVGGELHASFKLSATGEYLALVKPDALTVVHEYAPAYPPQTPDVSYGLLTPEAAAPAFLATLTPGQANTPMALGAAPGDVTFDAAGGLRDRPFDLELRAAEADSANRIVFTLDCSTPDPARGRVYAGPLRIERTTVVRARVVKRGQAPGRVCTRTFLFAGDVLRPSAAVTNSPLAAAYRMSPQVLSAQGQELHRALAALPALSLVTPLEHLYDPRSGIFVKPLLDGVESERSASVEWLEPGDRGGFQVNCGLRLYGGTSRQEPKCTFRLLFKEAYGPTKLVYRIFADPAATDTFDALILRGGNTDPLVRSGLADEFVRRTALAMAQPAPHGTFAHLYLNGFYWGVYNVVERPDVSFAASYLGGPKQDWDALNGGEPANESDMAPWQRMVASVTAGVKADADYFRLQGLAADGTRDWNLPVQLDVDGFIRYMLVHFWAQTGDWPGHNWYAACRRTDSTGWQFFPWDAELSVNNLNRNVTAEGGPGRLLHYLRANKRFADRFAELARVHLADAGALGAAVAASRYRELVAAVQPAVVAEAARWGNAGTPAAWARQQDWVLSTYMPKRTDVVWSQLRHARLCP